MVNIDKGIEGFISPPPTFICTKAGLHDPLYVINAVKTAIRIHICIGQKMTASELNKEVMP